MAHAKALPTASLSQLQHSIAEVQDFAGRCFAGAVEQGEMKLLAGDYARHAMSGMTNWFAKWYDPAGRLSLEEITRLQIDLWLYGLDSTGQVA